MRSEESPARAKRKDVSIRRDTRNVHVTEWLPIKDWSARKVWEVIEASGAPVHQAYALGMTRLSCVFCVLASKSDLRVAARHNPELLQAYQDVEQETGHLWREGVRLVNYLSPSRESS